MVAEQLVDMIAAHFLLDYSLQGDWWSKAKNYTLSLIPGERIWPLALSGHGWVHATAVLHITGSWTLFAVELVVHTLTDFLKCSGRFGYNVDQVVHCACKIAYAAALAWFGAIA